MPDYEAVQFVQVLFEFLHIIIGIRSFVSVAVTRLVDALRGNVVFVAKLEDVFFLSLKTHFPVYLELPHKRVHFVVLPRAINTEGKGKSG